MWAARQDLAKRMKLQIAPKRFLKMIMVMDTDGQGGILLIDDATAGNLATRQFEESLTIGRPFLMVPSRCPA